MKTNDIFVDAWSYYNSVASDRPVSCGRKQLVRSPGSIAIIDATVKLFIAYVGEGERLMTRSHKEIRDSPY